ncbi:hypothetical protein D6779_01160 [Candidatus Parcubacteria bacterium]|nr:MAG: hypothetical protein D6779_01160 [Candidatus Parcubacteria bacterium]
MKSPQKLLVLEVTRGYAVRPSSFFLSRKRVLHLFGPAHALTHIFLARARALTARIPLLVVLHPTLSSAHHFSLSFSHDSSRPVSVAEVEDFLGREAARLVHTARAAAAKRFGISEEEVVLVSGKVGTCMASGKPLPLLSRLRVRKLTLPLLFTFAPRVLYERLRPFLRSRERVFFTDRLQACGEVLARVLSRPFSLVVLDDGVLSLAHFPARRLGTSIPTRAHSRVTLADFTARISRDMKISPELAQELYFLYTGGALRDSAVAKLHGILRSLEEQVAKELRQLERSRARTVVGCALLGNPLAPSAFLPSFRILSPPLAAFLEAADISLPHGMSATEENSAPLLFSLAPFFSFYYDRGEESLNILLRRRLRWLGAMT